jgi:hypothetical protein
MFGKKCPSCDKRTRKKSNFCSSCGYSYRQKNSGNLTMGDLMGDIKMPFGLNGLMKTLVKQLDKELGNLDLDALEETQPRRFKIQISNGPPQMQKVHKVEVPSLEEEFEKVSDREAERRQNLKKVAAVSTIRRLPEGLVYEISAPGVKYKKEVVISQLEDGIEVRAYSKDKCYVKMIPVKSEIIGYQVGDEKVLLKLKG